MLVIKKDYICYKVFFFLEKMDIIRKNEERNKVMYKLINLEKQKYENFVKNHPTKSHFLQSYAWGEFSKKEKNLTPYYLGLIDEKKEIVASALLLQKKLPLNYSYFYSPRGFVLDYKNDEIFQKMTQEVILFIKKKKGIFLKIDPDIIKKSYNYLEEENKLNDDPKKIFNMIKKCGFKHLGFTKNFETNQPRYTFRIDLNQTMEEIESHFSKTTKQRISKAQKLKTEVEIGKEAELKEFYHLMTLTEERKDFVSYTEEYYQHLYQIFNQDNKMTLFLGKVDLETILADLKKEETDLTTTLNSLPTENLSKSAKNKQKEITKRIDKLQEDIKKYQNAQEKYGSKITLNAHMIIEYGDKAWVLYAGNHNILTETYANYHTYLEHLKFCKERNLHIYDQFGTIGDLRKDNPRMGLHEFKKKFGGDYVEFLGEFDYITNKPLYFIFTKLVPIYRNLIRNKTKKELKHEVSRNK